MKRIMKIFYEAMAIQCVFHIFTDECHDIHNLYGTIEE